MKSGENTCGKRFDWQLGELPRWFDHKYIYSHIGYNLFVMRHVLWVGVYPGLTEEMLAFVMSTFREFCSRDR